MQPALLVRLRPVGPWRYGPADGSQNRTDTLFRSDRLFSALSIAARQLGFEEEWLAATARASESAVAMSSLFPFQGDTLFAIPPAKFWPPPLVTAPSPVFLSKVRWSAVRFVPLSLIELILRRQSVLADQWAVDPESECLIRRDRPSSTPFRIISRCGAPVDRLTKTSSSAYIAAGVEFEPGAGLWTVIRFAGEAAQSAWGSRLRGMLRLLADSGLGGRRSSGWGHAHAPEFQEGTWPQILFPRLSRNHNDLSNEHWLLSLFSPGPNDSVDWASGVYEIIERGSVSGSIRRFVAEGSVLVASSAPSGRAVDLAKQNGKRPVYRSGIALTLQLPEWQVPETPEQEPARAVEEPAAEEAVEPRPCETVEAIPQAAAEPEPAPAPEPESQPAAATEPEAEAARLVEPESAVREKPEDVPEEPSHEV